MKLVNSKGRLLLEVYSAEVVNPTTGLYGRTVAEVFYSYRGPGIGGYGPLMQLDRTIRTVIADYPSAKRVGLLPQVNNYNGEQL